MPMPLRQSYARLPPPHFKENGEDEESKGLNTMTNLKSRLNACELLAGTWVKTPHPHIVEVMGLSPLDLIVLDAEHAPFGR